MLIKLKYFEFLTRSCDPRPTLGNLRMAILAQPHNKQWRNIIEAFVLKLLIKTHLALSLLGPDREDNGMFVGPRLVKRRLTRNHNKRS